MFILTANYCYGNNILIMLVSEWNTFAEGAEYISDVSLH